MLNGKLSYSEYCEKNFNLLKSDYLKRFDEQEIKNFWDSESDFIERMYNRYLKAEDNHDDGIAYFLSVMF